MMLAVLCLFLVSLVASRGDLVQLKPSVTPAVGTSEWECSTCVSFMDQALDQLINIIANVGIAGGCEAVCSELSQQWEQGVCMIVCEIAGIQEFANLVNDVDPDPLWICLEIDICPSNDHAAGTMQSVVVTPAKGPAGTTFTIDMTYKITNITGVGQVVIEVQPSDAFPFDFGNLIISQAPGLYKVSASFEATPQQDEPFNPGTYQVVAAVCEGSCGSIHSHSFTICQGQTKFVITP